jgi:hypothetical protein
MAAQQAAEATQRVEQKVAEIEAKQEVANEYAQYMAARQAAATEQRTAKRTAAATATAKRSVAEFKAVLAGEELSFGGVLKLTEFVPRCTKSSELTIAFAYSGVSDRFYYYVQVATINNKKGSAFLMISKSRFKQGVPEIGFYEATIDTRIKEYKGNAYYNWTYKFLGIAKGAEFDTAMEACTMRLLGAKMICCTHPNTARKE